MPIVFSNRGIVYAPPASGGGGSSGDPVILATDILNGPTSGGENRLQVFRCLLGSDSTGTQSFSSADSGIGGHVTIIEVQGIDTGGTNGSAAIVQAVDALTTGNDPNTFNVTLAALADAVNNAALSFFAGSGASTFTPSAGYTEVYDGAGTESASLSANYDVPGTTTPGTTNSSGFLDLAGFGIEIKAGGGGGSSVLMGQACL